MKASPCLAAGRTASPRVFLSVPLAVGLAVILSCASAAAQDQKIDPEALARERCVTCHDSRRVCRMLGARDRQGWFENVTRMVKNGARLNPAEVEAVATYLSRTGKNDPGLCK